MSDWQKGDEVAEVLRTVEVETGSPVDASVIWLHGLGADGHDFEPIVPALGLDNGVRFVFPHAPVRPVTINGGLSMRAWYDIMELGRNSAQDEAGIRSSEADVRRLIERENGRGVATDRIVLAGFSQGGAMALHTALRYPERLAGIIGLSTYLPLDDMLDGEAHASNRSTEIFMGHGTLDPLLPAQLGETARDYLVARNYTVEWHTYPIPHAVSPEEIDAVAGWLKQRFKTGTDTRT